MIKKLEYENRKDGESFHEVFLCDSKDHVNILRECLARQKHYFTPSKEKANGAYNNHKFYQTWKLVEKLNAINPLKNFLKNEGDNQSVPYLFASIFFNCLSIGLS